MRSLVTAAKENRLKIVSFLAVSGDILLAFAGVREMSTADGQSGGLLMSIAGLCGLVGHVCLFLWGRGGKIERLAKPAITMHKTILTKPFEPWRYPLDSAFFLWTIGGIFYCASGLVLHKTSVFFMGAFVLAAASLGWLWPEKKLIAGFRSVQITAALYFCSSISMLLAGLETKNMFLIVGSFLYGGCNLILYTVRKENQSDFTQSAGN